MRSQQDSARRIIQFAMAMKRQRHKKSTIRFFELSHDTEWPCGKASDFVSDLYLTMKLCSLHSNIIVKIVFLEVEMQILSWQALSGTPRASSLSLIEDDPSTLSFSDKDKYEVMHNFCYIYFPNLLYRDNTYIFISHNIFIICYLKDIISQD